MRSALVVGGDGVVGSALLALLIRRGWYARATSRREGAAIRFDLAAPGSLPTMDLSFLCAGVKGFKQCAADPAAARLVNVVGTIETAGHLVESGSRVVFLSSCAAETARSTIYGGMKYVVEKNMEKMGDGTSWLRFSRITDEPDGFTDGPYSSVRVTDVTEALMRMADSWEPGLHRLLAPNKLERPSTI